MTNREMRKHIRDWQNFKREVKFSNAVGTIIGWSLFILTVVVNIVRIGG